MATENDVLLNIDFQNILDDFITVKLEFLNVYRLLLICNCKR